MQTKLRPIGIVSCFTGLCLLYGLHTGVNINSIFGAITSKSTLFNAMKQYEKHPLFSHNEPRALDYYEIAALYAITGNVSSENIARIEETKYQASIRLKDRDNPFGNGHICGGCAISHKTILTTATCLFDFTGSFFSTRRLRYPYEISVVMGSTKLKERTPNTLVFDIMEMDFHQKYKSREMVSPRRYTTETIRYDVGLLFLKGEIPLGHPTVQPIPLASQPAQQFQECRVSGWGRVSSEGDSPNDLLIINVDILLGSSCKILYYKSGAFSLIKNGLFCTIRENDEDVCKSDPGAPLVCDNEVAGVLLWGLRCDLKWDPGIYTDVYDNKDWINESSGTHSINLNIFMYIKLLSLLSLLSIVKQ